MRRLLVMLLVLTLATPALAQLRVRVEPESASLYRGQTLTLRYVVSGADEPPAPPEIRVDGLDIAFAGAGQSSQTQIINGRRFSSMSFTFSYEITPKETGSFTIPPALFSAPKGDTARSRAVPVVATEAPEADDFRIRILTDRDRVYVGQPVRVTWSWYVGRTIRGAELEWPAPAGADVAVSRVSDPDLQRRPTIATLMGRSVALARDQRRVGGEVWDVYSAELILVPTRPGELTIPSASAIIEADTGRRRRGASLFDRRAVTETVAARSEPASITVLPLPDAGRPDDFSGLVGEFSIEAAAEPRNVRVGDPIELTVVLRGPEPLPERHELDLASRPGFAGAFRIDGRSDAPDGGSRAAIFKRTLRATRDDVGAIPPIEIPYFDPELGRYAVARTDAIPLEVAPTRVITLADAQRDADGPSPSGEAIESRAGGLVANVTSPAALRDESRDLRAVALAPATLAALAAPPALFALAGAVALARARRDRLGAASRRRRALPEAREALRNATTPDDVSAAIRRYLHDRWPHAEPPVAVDALAARPSREQEPLAAKLAELEERCDAARFGAAAVDARSLAAEAEALLGELDAGKEPR
jgi:hypothetical protein